VLLQSVAAAVHKNVAQVVLRWVLQMGALVIPRSSNMHHIMECSQLWDFSLDDQQMQSIIALDGTHKA
jgi:diketogulonate reductase-like aldo/keto reductase